MPTGIEAGHQVATTELTTKLVQDLMTHLVREGLDTSLRSLQVWSDLAHQLGPQVLGSSTDGTRVFLDSDYDIFKKLHAVQHEIVGKLVDTQRDLAQRYLTLQ